LNPGIPGVQQGLFRFHRRITRGTVCYSLRRSFTCKVSIDRHGALYRLPGESINRTYPSSPLADKWQRDVVGMKQVLVVRRSMESRKKLGACGVAFAGTLGDESLDAPHGISLLGGRTIVASIVVRAPTWVAPAVLAEARAELGGLLLCHLRSPPAGALSPNPAG